MKFCHGNTIYEANLSCIIKILSYLINSTRIYWINSNATIEI